MNVNYYYLFKDQKNIDKNNNPTDFQKEETIMNSDAFNSLPNHNGLECIENIMKQVKLQENHDIELCKTDYEVSEYPIEYYENQQHAIERHMKKKYF